MNIKRWTIAVMAVAFAVTTHAATVTWNAGTADSTDGLWSTATNWTADTAPSNGDDLIFDELFNQTNTNDLLTSINSLTLNNAGWNINLGTLAIGSGGITANGTSTLGGALTLSGAQSCSNSTGLLTVTGPVTIGTGGASMGGAGNITLSAALVADANLLTKVGSGKLTLTTNSTRTGALQIDGGTLRINSASAFGTTATAITINNSGTLEVATTGEIVTAGAGQNYINLNNGSTLLNGLTSGNVTVSKFIAIANTGTPVVTFNSGSNSASVLLIVNGSGGPRLRGGTAGAQIKILGTGTVKIANNATYTVNVIGDWVLQGGSLQIGGDGQLGNAANDVYFEGGTLSTYGPFTLSINRVLNFNHASGGTVNTTGGNLTLGTEGQLAGAYGLTKAGTKSLIISGTNALFSGSVTVSGGTLVLNGSSCLSDTNFLSIASGTTVQLGTDVKEKVGRLILGTEEKTAGIYGSSTSSAPLANQSSYFTGTGLLYVNVDDPKSGTLIYFQ